MFEQSLIDELSKAKEADQSSLRPLADRAIAALKSVTGRSVSGAGQQLTSESEEYIYGRIRLMLFDAGQKFAVYNNAESTQRLIAAVTAQSSLTEVAQRIAQLDLRANTTTHEPIDWSRLDPAAKMNTLLELVAQLTIDMSAIKQKLGA